MQKAQHVGDPQQTRLCWGQLFPDPSPLEIGSSWRLQTERAIAARQYPYLAQTAGHGCTEDSKTQGSAPAPARGCAQLALPRYGYFFSPSHLEEAQPGHPNLPYHHSRFSYADVPPATCSPPACARAREQPRV